MRRLTLLNLEWNVYQGFILEVLAIDTDAFTRSLFGIRVMKGTVELEVLWLRIRLIIFKSN